MRSGDGIRGDDPRRDPGMGSGEMIRGWDPGLAVSNLGGATEHALQRRVRYGLDLVVLGRCHARGWWWRCLHLEKVLGMGGR